MITTESPEIHVKIAEVKTGKPGQTLKATLGSCVGIVFHWPQKEISGMAHCLLAEAPERSIQIGAKYVSQAVPSLITLLKIGPDEVDQIEVRIYGGGNMMDQLARANTQHIGELNTESARSHLESAGFKIRTIDTGGVLGRQIVLNCSTGEVMVRKLGKVA